jgi:Flp pilus assembly protein TadG
VTAGDRDEGQAAVELALVLPLVVLLLLAVVQVTLVARDEVLVVHAARAGAREAAVAAPGGGDGEADGQVRRAALEASGLKSERTMTDMTRVGTTDTVIVRVRYAAPTDVPLIGPLLPDVTLDADVTMRSEWRTG